MKKLYLTLVGLLFCIASYALGPITGTTSFCTGSSVTLSNSTSGGTWSSSNAAVATIGVTSGIATGISAGYAVITYTASSSSVTTTVVVNPAPSAITGTTSACVGSTLTLSDAVAGGTWTSSDPTIAWIGTTSGIVTGISAGTADITYALGGTSCFVTTAVTFVPGSVTTYTVTGGGTFCAGGTGMAVGLNGSDVGTNYQLYNGATAVGTPVAGTGAPLSFGIYATPGMYSVTGTSGSCAVTMFSRASIDVNPLPTAYMVVGGGSFCSGGMGVNVGLTGSSWGVNYQLYVSGTPVGSAMMGTGSTLDFGPQTLPGTYTIMAINAATACTQVMTGSAIVTTISGACSGTPPAGSAMSSSTVICPGGSVGLSMPISDFICGTTFQWKSSPDGTTWSNISGATNYAVTHSPSAAAFYKCVITCPASGLSATSMPVHVGLHPYIASQTTMPPADTAACNTAHFYISACSASSTYNVTTWFGDGSSVNHLLTGGLSLDVFHTYANPGTYLVKQVLYDGTTARDSASFSYEQVNCHTLPLRLYFDANTNCTVDGGDVFVNSTSQIIIDSNGVTLDTVSIAGGLYYKALGSAGTVYSFRVLSDGLMVTCPSTGIIRDTIQAGVTSYDVKYVGMRCGATSFDLSVSAALRTGRHSYSGTITVNNRYCLATHTMLTVHHDPRYVTAYYPYPAVTSSTATTLTWDLGSLSASGSSAYISFDVEAPWGSWLTPGDTVGTVITVTPTSGDIDTSNNIIIRNDTVISSYDPNEISVSPKGATLPCTPLEYTIHFENTGNAPAENIAVLDTLPNNLDPKTLDIISSSAAMNLAIIKSGGYNIAKFDFPGIHLLDSSHHGQCTGFVIFKIKTKNGLPDGTAIPNRAGIYFDDNEVVMTNSVANTIGINPINGLDAVCTGSSITLTTANVGGAWSASNTHAALALGLVTGIDAGLDTIRYTMSNSCATKTAVKIVSVNTAPDAGTITGGNTVCAGSNITLTDAAGPGTWSSTNPAVAEVSTSGVVNGLGEGTAFIRYTRTNDCGTSSALTSMTVNPTPIPSVAISGNPGVFIGEGQSDTLIATVINGGATPTYQWAVNGVNVPGANTYFYVTDSLANNDSVSCMVTNSGDCGGLTTFNSVIVKVAPAGVGTIASANAIGIQPNPNKGSFVIKGTWNKTDESVTAEITNMLGQVVWTSQLKPVAGKISKQIAPDRQLADGVYLLNLRSASENRTIRFVVEK